jgi:hypothetical protein
VSAGTSLSPLLAERVAATALVVAVALSGLPSSNYVAPSSPVNPAPRTQLQGSSVRPERVAMAAHPAAVVDESANEGAEDITGGVPRLIEETLKSHHNLDTSAPRDNEEEDRRTINKEARNLTRDVVRQVGNVLPHGGPGLTPTGRI